MTQAAKEGDVIEQELTEEELAELSGFVGADQFTPAELEEFVAAYSANQMLAMYSQVQVQGEIS